MKPVAFNYDDYIALKTENNRLTAYIIELLKNHDDNICGKCKNEIKCSGEKCEHFEQGKGGTIDGKEYPDFEWTCKDFDWGTCRMMENTPCNGCFDGNYSGFEWRGAKEQTNGTP